LIDNLSGRLGNERVLGVMSGDDPLPENACQLYPLAGAQRSPASSRRPSARRHVSASPGSSCSHASHLPAATSPLRRPLTLLPEPLALQVESHEASSIPSRFRLPSQSRSIRILRHWGPERIESGWWRGPSVRRDYYRLETESGQWLWVFRILGENRWMLHGWFS
jgi:protein ImuB